MPNKLIRNTKTNEWFLLDDKGQRTKLQPDQVGKYLKASAKFQSDRTDTNTAGGVARGAALGAAKGIGIPQTQHPIMDMLHGLSAEGQRIGKESSQYPGPLGAMYATEHAIGRMASGLYKGEKEDIGKIPSDIRQKDYPALAEHATSAVARPASMLLGAGKAPELSGVGSPLKTVLGEGSGMEELVGAMKSGAEDLQGHVNQVVDPVGKQLRQAKDDVIAQMDSSVGGPKVSFNKAKTIAELKKMRDAIPRADTPSTLKNLFASTNLTGNFTSKELSELSEGLEAEKSPVSASIKRRIDSYLNLSAQGKGLTQKWQDASQHLSTFNSKVESNPAIRMIREAKNPEEILSPLASKTQRGDIIKSLSDLGVDKNKLVKAALLADRGHMAMRWSTPGKLDMLLAMQSPRAAMLRTLAPGVLRNIATHGKDLMKYTGARAVPTASAAIQAVGAAEGDTSTETAH
jgi:hypothetical protein